MTHEISFQDINRVGDELLALMLEHKLISDDDVQEISESADIMIEGEYLNNLRLLEEATGTPDLAIQGSHRVPWEVFQAVWLDYDKYPDQEKALTAMGIDPLRVNRPARLLSDLLTHFRKARHTDAADFVKFGDRRNYYTNIGKKSPKGEAFNRQKFEDEYNGIEPDRGDIDRGKRNLHDRTTRVMDNINAAKTLPGDFYSDISRIKKSTAWRWLQFWKKDVAKAKPVTMSEGTIRRWKKIFVMGYATKIGKDVLFEVWYNTLDATFTIHDINGTQLGKRYQTLAETLRYFMSQIATTDLEGSGDSVVTSRRDALNASIGIARQLKRVVDPYVVDLENKNVKEIETALNIARDEAEKENKQFDKKTDRFSATASVIDIIRANQQRVKRELNNQSNGITDVASSIAASQNTREKVTSILANSEDVRRKEEEREAKEREREERIANEAQAKENAKNARLQERRSRIAAANAQYMRERTLRQQERVKAASAKNSKIASAQKEAARVKAVGKYNKKVASVTTKKPAKRVTKTLKDNFETFLDDGEFILHESRDSDLSKIFDMEEPLDDTPEDEIEAEQENNFEKAIRSSSYDSLLRGIKKNTIKHSKSVGAVKDAIENNTLDVYEDKTRAKIGTSFLANLFRGRKQKIVTPRDGILKRAFTSLVGSKYRADFVIGYTFKDRVNVEIWYVTEKNTETKNKKNAPPYIASYYVYDVTSGLVIRKYLPYYRNAIQTVMQKMGI